MSRIYAASLSLSQGAGVPQVSATLLVSENGRQTTVNLGWDLPTPINPGDNPGEWLYAMLSRVVQDYDEHVVNAATVEPSHLTQETTND